MKNVEYLMLLFLLYGFCDIQAKRFLLDAGKNSSQKITKCCVVQAVSQCESVCEAHQKNGQDACCCDEGRPSKICCNKNRVKSEYFRYGPYTYPYIYNQPGFYFGVGIPRAHYW